MKNTFKFPVFLKFHNNGNQHITTPEYQYNFWVSIFEGAEVTVISEDNTVKPFCKHKIIEKISDYSMDSWQKKVINTTTNHWQRITEVNLTPTISSDYKYFWLIDADDLMFLINNPEDKNKIIDSLLKVEKIVEKQKLKFCNLDINYSYHEYTLQNALENINWGHSCFGVCLIKNENFYDLENIKTEFFGINHDLLLEVFHHRHKKSKIFSITDIKFEQYNCGDQIQHSLLFKDGFLFGNFYELEVKVPIKSHIIF